MIPPPRPASPVENKASARMSSREQPTKPTLGKFSEILALLKPNFLQDTEVYDKFVDGVSKVIDSSFFVTHET